MKLSSQSTFPNILTILRIAGIPVFVLLMAREKYDLALWLLLCLAFTDFLDGYLARKLNQVTQLGAYLDPIADRLFMVIVPVMLCLKHQLPLWGLILIFSREILIISLGPFLRRAGVLFLPSHYVGKLATLLLMSAAVVLLASSTHTFSTHAHLVHAAGLALLIWGIALYFYSAIIYVIQTVTVVKK